ncbi:hydroxyisourate hydrolase [Bergeyella cardium]|uniref:hydroxyisourate hydrolase n=1 Tax=Bergeyella cardium TaxID=1585976 RepID=UPI000EA1899E|nr:hydroxyisourate hydrolase [Bergeyella cardium]
MKKLLLVLFSVMYLGVYAQKNKNFQLSSHILDISTGRPAPQVEVELEKYNDISKQWVFITKKMTDNNGRITDFLPLIKGKNENHGKYRLRFLTENYFTNQKTESFYPYIEVVFQIKNDEHYHVPITLSPFGYSTYRGN